MTATSEVLRFRVETSRPRESQESERYYRIELPDGREVLILASKVTVQDGALIAASDDDITLVLAPGMWRSAFMCEAILAHDAWSILDLEKPIGE